MSGSASNDPSLIELFRRDAETQIAVLTTGLLALDRDPRSADHLDACMRAAHSLKGAASIVDIPAITRIAHAMEDCFVAAQQGRITLGQSAVDALLDGVDRLTRLARDESAGHDAAEIAGWLSAIASVTDGAGSAASETGDQAQAPDKHAHTETEGADDSAASAAPDRVVRITAENLNHLLGLAGEAVVASQWVTPFRESLLRLKRLHQETNRAVEKLRATLTTRALDEKEVADLTALQLMVLGCGEQLSHRLVELETFDRRSVDLTRRLYDRALRSRMRPFADGVQQFPRVARDLARSLGKQVRLDIVGDSTQVDRDILTRLQAPLGHLIRNAIDHGIESPDERRAAGKPVDGVVRLEARHQAGALCVVVSDDGKGVDLARVRQKVVERNLIAAEAAAVLTDAELLEFLFLPGFTMRTAVTDISGRGVGLDVVRDMVARLRGTVRASSRAGKGTRFELHLPVTLSVVRTLLTEVAGETYAFPLTAITKSVKLPRESLESLEGRYHFDLSGTRVGLVTAHQVLELPEHIAEEVLSVLVISDANRAYGVIVDKFLGERELVVQPLDAQLGKIKDIAAGALLEDGSPVLIVDTEDLLQSLDKIVSTNGLTKVGRAAPVDGAAKRRKRVLVVDDSLTVREVERKLLVSHGYEVEVAVDGMDGWNAVRTGQFDLVVTDIDMPRMDGIELVELIKRDSRLESIPVMVVSYKDREEDRRRGLDAGAAYYLSKSSFHDDTLVQAVVNLIGEAGG